MLVQKIADDLEVAALNHPCIHNIVFLICKVVYETCSQAEASRTNDRGQSTPGMPIGSAGGSQRFLHEPAAFQIAPWERIFQ
jgi:hypothetical protein